MPSKAKPIPQRHRGHAEIRLGDSLIMLSDEFPEYGGKAPDTLGGSPVSLLGVATHKEDVAPDEMQKRVQAMFASKQ
jgi:uncharacterized glyoxalase superfamily protein PhnB